MNIQNINGLYPIESRSHIQNQPPRPTEKEQAQVSTSAVSAMDDRHAWMGMYDPTHMLPQDMRKFSRDLYYSGKISAAAFIRLDMSTRDMVLDQGHQIGWRDKPNVATNYVHFFNQEFENAVNQGHSEREQTIQSILSLFDKMTHYQTSKQIDTQA